TASVRAAGSVIAGPPIVGQCAVPEAVTRFCCTCEWGARGPVSVGHDAPADGDAGTGGGAGCWGGGVCTETGLRLGGGFTALVAGFGLRLGLGVGLGLGDVRPMGDADAPSSWAVAATTWFGSATLCLLSPYPTAATTATSVTTVTTAPATAIRPPTLLR